MILPLLIGPAGLLMWGVGLNNRAPWAVPAIGSGISYGVLCAVPNIGMTYVVDTYRPVAGEAMTSLTAFKNTFAFGLSFAVYPWIVKDGFTLVSFSNFTSITESLVCVELTHLTENSSFHRWPDIRPSSKESFSS
jgi:hypothetical protein